MVRTRCIFALCSSLFIRCRRHRPDPDANDVDEEANEQDDPCVSFEVPINDERTCRVVFSGEDVSTLQALVTRTGLSELDAQVVCKLLLDCSSDGVLEEGAYMTWCERQLLPAGVLDDAERMAFMSLLSSLYDAFNRDGRGTVDAAEFASGFSVLCAGSKSAKLAAAWELLDDDGDGLLSRRGLWRYLRSFLTMLLCIGCKFSPSTYSMDIQQLGSHADACSVLLSSRIFGDAVGADNVHFDLFAEWCVLFARCPCLFPVVVTRGLRRYTQGGSAVASWLELLDNRKVKKTSHASLSVRASVHVC